MSRKPVQRPSRPPGKPWNMAPAAPMAGSEDKLEKEQEIGNQEMSSSEGGLMKSSETSQFQERNSGNGNRPQTNFRAPNGPGHRRGGYRDNPRSLQYGYSNGWQYKGHSGGTSTRGGMRNGADNNSTAGRGGRRPRGGYSRRDFNSGQF